MGIYSLQSYLYDGLILRTIGYVMQGRVSHTKKCFVLSIPATII